MAIDKNGFCPSLVKILKEMCKRVGAKYKDIDFHADDWYKKYNWTLKEEKDFEKWLTEFLYNNSKARKELMTITSKNKKWCKEASIYFVFQYGWVIKDMTVGDVENKISEVANLERK